MPKSLLEVGAVIGVHGLQGLLRIKLFSREPQGLVQAGHVVLVLPDGRQSERRVDRLQVQGRGQALLALEGVQDRDAAEALRGASVSVRRELLPPLTAGEFYLADLIGCAAVTPTGKPLGVVSKVGDNGAQPLIFLDDGPERYHVPAVAPFVRDFDGVRLVLELPDGLREAVTEDREEEA